MPVRVPSRASPSVELQLEELRYAITSKTLYRVLDHFRSMDANQDGRISKSEFRASLKDKPDLHSIADRLFDMLDSDESGSLSHKELNKALRQGASVKLAPELRAGAAGAIETFDIRENGYQRKLIPTEMVEVITSWATTI